MATTIDQQVALDEALVPSTKRLRIGRSNFRLPSDIQSKESTLQVVYDVLRISPFFRAFQVTADVPEIYMQEFWATAKIHHDSIRIKIDTKKSVLDLEAFREMLHISPRIPSQSFAELPSEEEILEFLSKAYKDYYACATGEAAPKPKASARKKKGDSASSTTPPTPTPTTIVVSAPRLSATAKGKQPTRAITPTEPTDVERKEAEQLKIVLKRSRQEMHVSQQRGSGTDEGTGSRPWVLDVPSDDSEEELSWNSSDDEEGDEQTKGREESEGDKTDESDDGSDDDNDDEEESGKGGDEVSESEGESDEEETRQEEEESFDPIPRTLEWSEDEIQIQTDRLQDSLRRENGEFLRNIDENMKKIIKGQVKSLVKEQVSRILPRIEEYVNATLEAEALVEAYDADKAILDTYGESTILKRRIEDDDQEGPFAGSDWGSKRQKEGGEHASASTPSKTATESAGRSTKGSQSRQLSASESAFAEKPVQTTCQMEEPPHPPRRPPSPDHDWNKTLPSAQEDAQS
uniref:Uncharacterized protein n=1 Tax=Tanacetum cinerariifolium TaxID=118510 RepID=A0A6L2K7Y3_TANCI|nr:hypothetical protein [Tanacetum cinerariifolium]